MPNKESYQCYKALGICPTCGVESAKPGNVRCAGCIQKSHEARAARDSKGKCARCGKRKKPGHQRCAGCARDDRRNAKRQRDRRREQAVCLICGGEIEYAREGHSTCEFCGTRRNTQSQRRRDEAKRAKIGAAHG